MTANPNSPAADQPPTFEAALARIEAIVQELEEGQTGLAESLGRYEEGVNLLRQCYGLLDQAEHKIELLLRIDAAGSPVSEPFDATASTDRDPSDPTRPRRRAATSGKGAVRQSAEIPSQKTSPGNSAAAPAEGLF